MFIENYAKWQKELWAFAYSLTQNSADADDLLQDACVNGHRHYDKFEEGTNFRAWMGRIIFNQFINNDRKRKRRVGTVSMDNKEYLETLAAGSTPTPVDVLSKEDLHPEIVQALNQLPPEYRVMLELLASSMNYSYKEMAKILGIPMGTVMSRLSRAKDRMRALLPDREALCS